MPWTPAQLSPSPKAAQGLLGGVLGIEARGAGALGRRAVAALVDVDLRSVHVTLLGLAYVYKLSDIQMDVKRFLRDFFLREMPSD